MAGIYVHIPFCSQRCIYCDFYFVTTRRQHASYVAALTTEIEHYAARYGSAEPIHTVYFGGGTPSKMSVDDVGIILSAIRDGFDVQNVAETTFELNPEDGTDSYLRALRDAGIDRLSIGIQSFFAGDLEFMNRSHRVDEAEAVIGSARSAGFDNISVDLIFGVPDQPMEYWAANLEKIARLDVPHISTYGLTVEKGTPLGKAVERGKIAKVDDDTMAERYRFTMAYLEDCGYEHYEISNFALPGHRSKHNQAYWAHANYLGFGPSAHSLWWKGLPARRWSNVRNINRYESLLIQHHVPLDMDEKLSLDDLANEYIMLRLRTSDGLDLDYLENQYGIDLYDERIDDLAWLESEELIMPIRNAIVRLTDEGKLLCDIVTSKLLLG